MTTYKSGKAKDIIEDHFQAPSQEVNMHGSIVKLSTWEVMRTSDIIKLLVQEVEKKCNAI